jgi:hypothetical protein
MKLRLARRVDEVEQWKKSGYASAAEYLAAEQGSTVAAAREILGASSKLRSLSVVEDALRAGNRQRYLRVFTEGNSQIPRVSPGHHRWWIAPLASPAGGIS